MAIWYYLPFLFFPVLSFFWLRAAGIPVGEAFRWNRFPPVFYLALLCSIGYSVYLLVSGYPDLKGGLYWVPVAVLSIMNSVGEEFAFRHAVFEIFQNAGYSISVSNGIQGILYAVPHFIIGGASFGILAFFYGLLLGTVRMRAGSITPCIISHFFIDIGCIGLPMLAL
ncbi:MAG: CPBP family intramembrane metalloprotease, partial [Desulfobacterales bacterium]|nr:CPBP family intramembrane metalloprotease [Desulfobacterales bacterium]